MAIFVPKPLPVVALAPLLARRNLRIGLYGGSFNPPHAGHRHVALMALKRLQLDVVFWLVSPGNPLKKHDGLAPLEARLMQTRLLATHPRMRVLALESALNTRYSVDLIAQLCRRIPCARFVWIMGGDSLDNFHEWKQWQDFVQHIPIAVIDRPQHTMTPLSSVFARRFHAYRLNERFATKLSLCAAPAWVFLHGARNALSSTQLRGH